MRVDASVQQVKFARQVQLLRDQEPTLREWGVWCTRAENPIVDVVFVPRIPLRLTMPVQATPGGILLPPGAAFATTNLAPLAGRAFAVRFSLDDYDQRAPSVSFRDPWTWVVPNFEAMMRATTQAPGGQPTNVILPAHPVTKEPFLCIRGVREYHEHPQHSGDDWALYRASSSLFGLIQHVWKICISELRPNLVLPGQPGQTVQIRWETEMKPR
jgi:hypothetical protein